MLERHFEEYTVGTFEKRTKDSNIAALSLALLVKQYLFCFDQYVGTVPSKKILH